jgi:hypothetical protein
MKRISTINLRSTSLRRAGTAVVIALLVLAPAGCKKKEAAPPPPVTDASAQVEGIKRGPTGPAKIHIANGNGVSVAGGAANSFNHTTYSSKVKLFSDGEVRSSLQGISSDGHGWLFKNAGPNIKNLKAGDVFMVKGEMAGKVLGVVTKDDQTLVEMGQASLMDVVAGGQLKIDAPVRFSGAAKTSKAEPNPFLKQLHDMIEPTVYADSPDNIATHAAVAAGNKDAAIQSVTAMGGAVLSGWTVTDYEFTPQDSTVQFHIVLQKDVGGFVARISVLGNITNFEFATYLDWSTIKATGGKYIGPSIASSVKNMQGNLKFDWEIGKQTPGVWATEDRVALPGGISVPLAPILDGMPLTLDVSSALLIHPALTGGNEFSRGGFTVQWGGNGMGGGFSTESTGAVTDDGANINMTFGITDDMNISPVAPNAMVISYCAPRIELRLDILGPFADSVSGIVGSAIDTAVGILKSYLAPGIQAAIANSPLSKMTVSNVLASNADVFVQFITTEGVTHSSNVTLAPCTKQKIKFDGEGGLGAQLFGMTDGAKTTTDIFTKTYTHWVPDTPFCRDL